MVHAPPPGRANRTATPDGAADPRAPPPRNPAAQMVVPRHRGHAAAGGTPVTALADAVRGLDPDQPGADEELETKLEGVAEQLLPLTEVSDHGGKEFGMLGSKVSAASDRRRRLARPYGRPLDQTGEMRGEKSHGWRTR